MTGVLDQQATCRAGVSEAGTGLTAHWPPSQSCTSRQRTAQPMTLGPAGRVPWPGASHCGWLGLEPLTDGIYAPWGPARQESRLRSRVGSIERR